MGPGRVLFGPYLAALLSGAASDAAPPAQAKEISLVHADAADYLERQPAGGFDGFTLSNILDGAAQAYRPRLMAAVKHAARPGAIVVLRSFREPKSTLLTNRAADDRAALWGIVDVRPAADLQ
jgi:S-adenosylmethionine:diacylglycerol 3-amino-3-carboxypropyl transferase